MSLQNGVRARAIPALANDRVSGSAQSPSGRAGRFVARLRSVLGRAIGAILVRSRAPVIDPLAAPPGDVVQLGRSARGIRGTVVQVGAKTGTVSDCIAAAELERLLLEIGFVEGAAIEILHEGFIRGDPIAVRLDDMRVALRRKEADAILVRVAGGSSPAAGSGN